MNSKKTTEEITERTTKNTTEGTTEKTTEKTTDIKSTEQIINNLTNITGEDLKNVICDRIFKSLILFLYYHEDKYRNFLEETIDTYMKFMIEYEGEIYAKNEKRFPVELNRKIKLWIYYPNEDDSDKILYHIRGKIIFSELNQPRIYGLITKDYPLRIYPTEDWLELAESIMDHDDITNDEERKKLGKEGWRLKFGRKGYKNNQQEDLKKEEDSKNKKDSEKKDDDFEKKDDDFEKKDDDFEKKDDDSSKEEKNNIITKEIIYAMKLPELKGEAKKVGLNIYGKKSDIQKKLLEYYKIN